MHWTRQWSLDLHCDNSHSSYADLCIAPNLYDAILRVLGSFLPEILTTDATTSSLLHLQSGPSAPPPALGLFMCSAYLSGLSLLLQTKAVQADFAVV